MRKLWLILALFLAGCASVARAEAPTASPTLFNTSTPQPSATPLRALTAFPTATPTITAVPAPTSQPDGIRLGLAGQVQCFNCAPFSVKIYLSTYDPMSGPTSCFDYHDNYCWSPVSLMVHWKSFYGFGAACSQTWKFGTWVEIPTVGWFICVDHGDSIICNPDTGICNVDIMAPMGYPWDQKLFENATIWVPLDPAKEDK